MTTDELLALTPEQEKAWRRIKSGVKAFTEAGGKFYTVLESMHAYNGKYVSKITTGEDMSQYYAADAHMDFIFNWGIAGFADDDHFIHLTDEGEALIEGE